MKPRHASAGFTILEILIVMGIITVLAALLFPLSKGLFEKAKSVREMNAARRAIVAWIAYSTENNGKLLVGYADSADPELTGVNDGKGNGVHGVAARRYPYRLAPYLDYELKGALLVNGQASLTDPYSISMQPSFGMNATFVGGDYSTLSLLNPKTYGQYVDQYMARLHSPSKLIVFASARITDASFKPHIRGASFGQKEGYNAILPPYVFSRVWASVPYDEKRPYTDFGYLHFRYQKRAVCAMADGHIELLNDTELQDMRRWANQAAIADNPNWVVPP